MKKTAPLRTPTAAGRGPRSRSEISRRARATRAGAPPRRPGPRRRRARARPGSRALAFTPGASTRPGTATTSSPRTTSGHASRSERGTFASTNTSCTFLRRPASLIARAPASHVKPGELGLDRPRAPADLAVEARPGPARARARSYSRTAWTPPPRSTRFEPAGEASSSASAGGSGRAPRAARSRFSSAAGWSRRRSGRISSRIRPRFVSGFERVVAERRGPRRAQYAAVSSRQSGEQRADDAVLAARLDPCRRAARDEPVEDRLDLVGGRVARRAQPVGARTSSGCSRSSASVAAGRGRRRPRRRARSRQKRASSSDSAPRRPWFTCSADTR